MSSWQAQESPAQARAFDFLLAGRALHRSDSPSADTPVLNRACLVD